jgi:Sulfatase-modifying factor enzyme 1/Protein of unknown function (DUF4019)
VAWLERADRGDYLGCYGQSAARVRERLTADAFVKFVADGHAASGKLLSRTFAAAKPLPDDPSRPAGAYLDVSFDAHYATIADAIEDVRLMKESDGAWRVAGYHVTQAPCRATDPGPSSLPAPPQELGLDPFYAKFLLADGVPIVSSARASDHALRSALTIVRRMLRKRPDIRDRLIAEGARLVVMSPTEQTLDIPEQAFLRGTPTDTPGVDWNERTRGLGGTIDLPLASCGEENLLCLPCDTAGREQVLIHEFGHLIERVGLAWDEVFKRALVAAYDAAVAKDLWHGAYPSRNKHEYWAVGVESWFDANVPEQRHSRAELATFDPPLYALVAQIFPDDDWRFACGDTSDVPAGVPAAVQTRATPEIRPPPRACPAGMVVVSGGAFALAPEGAVQPFCLDASEVTVGAYAACARSGRCSPAPTTVNVPGLPQEKQAPWNALCNGARADRLQHPANCVDLSQAAAYCRALGKRLPTEPEWQWAARGTRAPRDQLCWSGEDKHDGTCEVGSFRQGDTPEGIHDLAGNVWELTASGIGKGGGFNSQQPPSVRVTNRTEGDPAFRAHTTGFRCAK